MSAATNAQIATAVGGLLPLIEENAGESERSRRVSQPVIEALTATGVHTLTQHFLVAPATIELSGRALFGLEVEPGFL
jgi:hypothetical protein